MKKVTKLSLNSLVRPFPLKGKIRKIFLRERKFYIEHKPLKSNEKNAKIS